MGDFFLSQCRPALKLLGVSIVPYKLLPDDPAVRAAPGGYWTSQWFLSVGCPSMGAVRKKNLCWAVILVARL